MKLQILRTHRSKAFFLYLYLYLWRPRGLWRGARAPIRQKAEGDDVIFSPGWWKRGLEASIAAARVTWIHNRGITNQSCLHLKGYFNLFRKLAPFLSRWEAGVKICTTCVNTKLPLKVSQLGEEASEGKHIKIYLICTISFGDHDISLSLYGLLSEPHRLHMESIFPSPLKFANSFQQMLNKQPEYFFTLL